MGEKKEERCNDWRCQGAINLNELFRIKINSNQGQKNFEYGYPCSKCGLLHVRGTMANFFEKDSDRMLYFEKGEKVFK